MMIKEPSWRTKTIYVVFAFALVFGLTATVLTVAPQQDATAQVPQFTLVPSIALNVKTADETFTVLWTSNGLPVDGSRVLDWVVVQGEGGGEVSLVAGGQPGDNFITICKVVVGDAIVVATVNGSPGPNEVVNAEKKWGEIVDTVLEATPNQNIQIGQTVRVHEQVIADFLPGPVEAPAGGAKITWWLLQNDDLDDAQTRLEALVDSFDVSSHTSGPLGYGEGCGQYGFWQLSLNGSPFFPYEVIENGINGIYDDHEAIATKFIAEEGVGASPGTPLPTPVTKWVTYTDTWAQPLGEGNTNMDVTFSELSGGEAEPVIVVVLADYPWDKNGENNVCVEYMKFTPYLMEFNPDFIGEPRSCDEPSCCVEFTNLTTGGVLPYQDAVWDFGDGSAMAGVAVNYGETIEHCYTTSGTFDVMLTMWDADLTEAFQVEMDYISVGDLVPMLTWGTVTLNGAPAPVGTTVEVFIGADTTPSGSGIVTTAGQYGAIPVSASSSRYGEPLTYKVNGYVATTEKVMQPCDTLFTPVFGLCNQVVNLFALGDPTTTWSFSGLGFWPKHLPDDYMGEVVLADLNIGTIPAEVQGVYWYDCVGHAWRFWAPGAPGCTLSTLGGGHTFDYFVAVAGPCDWEIPLAPSAPVPTPTPTPAPTLTPTPTPSPAVPHDWSFCSPGFFPHHLPDSYFGEVVLGALNLATIPTEVQGVWYNDAGDWLFWVPGIGGELTTLHGGTVADYGVLVSGPCDWEIPLP